MFKNTKLIGLFSLTAHLFSLGIAAPALSESQEYPSQVATDSYSRATWELESCTKKQNDVVSCVFLLTSDQDANNTIYTGNGTKLVDNEGNEYYVRKVQVLKGVVGPNTSLSLNMVVGSKYKATVDFSDIPASVLYATSLQITTYGSLVEFRRVPFINFDGSIPNVPRPARSRPKQDQSTPATNNIFTIPRICLPFIGCR